MKINITWGVGIGKTKLSSFDAALFDAGIANFNLIKLSSVIPPNTSIQLAKIDYNNMYIGFKLYGVISSLIITNTSEECYVGLGWVNNTKRGGIFIESNANNLTQLKTDINSSLNEMKKRRHIKGENKFKLIRLSPNKNYSCGVICAVYKIEEW